MTGLDRGLRVRGGGGSSGAGDWRSEVGMGSRGSPRSPVPSGLRVSCSLRAGVKLPQSYC